MRKSAPVKLLWPLPRPWFTNNWRTWELVYPSLWLNEIQRMKSVQVFWVYWEFSTRLDRKPRCLQERRETRYFCHGLWGFLAEVWHTTQPGTRDTAWHCEAKPWKELPVCCNEAQHVPLATLPLFRRRLWPTIYTLRSIQRQWTSPTSHLLICLGHEHAQKASKSDRACVLDLSSKSLWSSLVSCEEMSQEWKQSMAPWSKSKHDQIPHWCKHTRPTLHLEQSA